MSDVVTESPPLLVERADTRPIMLPAEEQTPFPWVRVLLIGTWWVVLAVALVWGMTL